MGYAVNEYCYASITEAQTAFNSSATRFYGAGSGFGETHLHSDATINFHVYPLSGNPPPHIPSGHLLPSCDTPGPLNSIVYGIDWTVVEWIFGAGLVMFATGAAVGAVINVVRKARV